MKNSRTAARGLGGRLTKLQATSRPDHFWPEIWSGMTNAAQPREKLRWATEMSKFDNARKLIYFIDPNDLEFKGTMENSRNKLWLSVESAMPCKVQNRGHGEICGENKSNTRERHYQEWSLRHDLTQHRKNTPGPDMVRLDRQKALS